MRCARFIAKKSWIITGSDVRAAPRVVSLYRIMPLVPQMAALFDLVQDMQIRIYNFNTMEKVKTFEAHTDYIRCACSSRA